MDTWDTIVQDGETYVMKLTYGTSKRIHNIREVV